MVIVMPALAHAGESCPDDVIALARRAIDDEALGASTMGEMSDQPAAGDAHATANTDAPNHPAPAADDKKQHSPGNLLQHPGPLHEGIEPVVREPRLQPECRRMLQNQPAMQLPPCILPEPRPMAGIVVASRLSLRPVAEIMKANHAAWPRHSDQC